jgi:hypothetical protein
MFARCLLWAQFAGFSTEDDYKLQEFGSKVLGTTFVPKKGDDELSNLCRTPMVLFPQLYGKCQGDARKDGARPALFLIFLLLYVFFVLIYAFFVLFYIFFLCCSM